MNRLFAISLALLIAPGIPFRARSQGILPSPNVSLALSYSNAYPVIRISGPAGKAVVCQIQSVDALGTGWSHRGMRIFTNSCVFTDSSLAVQARLYRGFVATNCHLNVEGDSLSSPAPCICPDPAGLPGWPELIGNPAVIVTNHAVSGGGYCEWPTNKHVISDAYDAQDAPWRPALTHAPCVMVFIGGHNDLMRVGLDELVTTVSNLCAKARDNGQIVVLGTVPASALLTGDNEFKRLAYNDWVMRQEVSDVRWDSAHVWPDDTSDAVYRYDGTHPTLYGRILWARDLGAVLGIDLQVADPPS